jgi:hypothetical protein
MYIDLARCRRWRLPTDVTSALLSVCQETQVSAVVAKLPGSRGAAAGSTLFYTDPGARYLIIGRVCQALETLPHRSDLTAYLDSIDHSSDVPPGNPVR